MKNRECRIGQKVKVIDGTSLANGTIVKVVSVNYKSDGSEDTICISRLDREEKLGEWYVHKFELVEDVKVEKKEEKPVTHIVTWDEDNRDPYKLFSDEDVAKQFIKELSDKTNVKKDSIKIFAVKSASKVRIEKVLRLSNFKIA